MHATPDTVALLKPLGDFYTGRPMPEVRFVAADAIPEPYRRLLDHPNDMTSTLQSFHDEALRVHVLDSRQDGAHYQREVLLVTRDSGRTVEFGAIEISLEPFPAGAQREILRAEMPLGGILHSFRIEYQSTPGAFFQIESDDVMNKAFKLSSSQTLYGRCNEITNANGAVLAAIVEVLPPVTGDSHHA